MNKDYEQGFKDGESSVRADWIGELADKLGEGDYTPKSIADEILRLRELLKQIGGK